MCAGGVWVCGLRHGADHGTGLYSAAAVAREVRSRWPLAVVRTNRGRGRGYKLQRSGSFAPNHDTGFKNYINVRTNQVERYPRLGSFEVVLNERVGQVSTSTSVWLWRHPRRSDVLAFAPWCVPGVRTQLLSSKLRTNKWPNIDAMMERMETRLAKWKRTLVDAVAVVVGWDGPWS